MLMKNIAFEFYKIFFFNGVYWVGQSWFVFFAYFTEQKQTRTVENDAAVTGVK